MQLKRRDVLLGLKKLGEIVQGGNHEKCRVSVDGKKVGTIPIPGDSDDRLIHLVARPLHLKNKPFVEVCDCTKDGSWYHSYLISEGKL